jgi:predicted metal-dependent TIM-barrel fold hydrolase
MKKRSAEEIERLADEGIKKLKEVVRAMEPRKLMESLKEYIEVLEKCEMTERGERIRKLWRQRGS